MSIVISRIVLVAILLVTTSCAALAQSSHRGREFYIAFMPTNGYDDVPMFTISVTAVRDGVRGRLQYSDNSFDDATITVGRTATEFVLDTLLLLLPNPNVAEVSRRTLHMSFDDDVTIHGLNAMRWSGDGFLALPVPALGTEYMVAAYPNTVQAFPSEDNTLVSDFPSQFCVVAIEDGTTVTVHPTARINNRADQTTFSVTLDRGEVFLAHAEGIIGTDLTGTRIGASRPVAVFAGQQRGNVPFTEATGRDHLVEQLVPLSRWGRHFMVAPHYRLATSDSDSSFDRVRIVASDIATTVTISNHGNRVLTAGEVIEVPLLEAMTIDADKPVFVFELHRSMAAMPKVHGDSIGDPFMSTVVPNEHYDTSYAFTTMGGDDILQHFVNAIVPAWEQGSLMLDGRPVTEPAHPVPGMPYVYVQIPVAPGAHTLGAGAPFGAMSYGYGPFSSYGFPLGMVFDALTVGVPLETAVSTRLTATPNPVVGAIALRLELAHAALASIEIVDARGVVVARLPERRFEAGEQMIAIDVPLAAGTYWGRVVSEEAVGFATTIVVR